MSDEHFTVDGTRIQAWASQKSFRRKDGCGDDGDGSNFHGQKRSNETHESTTDPDARLYKKSYGKESHLAYPGPALVESRDQLQAYLDEFVFRHNPRQTPMAAFQTLLGLGTAHRPVPYLQIRAASDLPSPSRD